MTTQTDRWRSLDRRHHLNPFTDYRELKREKGGSRIIERASGVRVYDSEGVALLDGLSGLWCVQIGHGRAELADAAAAQMRELAYYNSFFQTTTPRTVELAGKLAELTPAGLTRAFFGSSGSESNDTVVRLARWYWHVMGRPEKKGFITRERSYHGSTLASASLGGLPTMQEGFGIPLPGFHHVMPPYAFGLAEPGEDEKSFGLRAAQAVEAKILEVGAENVAAFVGEPVMAAGGLIVPPPGYWPEVQRICRAHDVLFVADEVICGFGRTGRWFGSDTYGVEPDMITLAKGITSGYLPLSAVMVSDRIAGGLEEAGGEFYHGYTYSGHPVACAVALENLRILEEESIVERVGQELAPYFQARLAKLADHPIVGEVRGVGLLGAVELVRDRDTRERWDDQATAGRLVRDACIDNGLIARSLGDTMALSPPLVSTTEELDDMISRLERSIDQVSKKLRSG